MKRRKAPHQPQRSQAEWLELTRRYFEGETTLEEEAELRRFVVSDASSDPAFDELRAVISYSARPREAMVRPIAPARPARVAWMRVAAVALLLVGCGLGYLHFRSSADEGHLQAYVYGEKVTDPDEVMDQMRSVMQDVCGGSPNAVIQSQMKNVLNPAGKALL
jgi:ferric-dicitrate binding protein FerR (iron transport regulator)